MNPTGRTGETLAARYLERAGYKMLKKNFISPFGEVDIIAVRHQVLVFCEVKSWITYGWSEIEYSIDHRKRRRIVNTAMEFLRRNPHYGDFSIRFDIVFVPQDSMDNVRHVENIFD